MPTPTIVRAQRRGLRGWLNIETGRFIPLIAGADDDAEAAAKATAEKEAAEKAAADEAAKKKAEEDAAAKAAEEKLGDAGKAALDAERKAKREAEKRAKDAEAKLKALEDEKLSDTEKLKKQAEEGVKAAATATEKLRQANLITALADKGLTGGKAKAAARLLDSVEYDDADEPTNLDAALDAGKAVYGEEMFAAGEPPKPKPGGSTNGGDGGSKDEKPELTADELEAAKATGTSPERYAAMKNVTTLDEYQAAQKALKAAEKQ